MNPDEYTVERVCYELGQAIGIIQALVTTGADPISTELARNFLARHLEVTGLDGDPT